MEINDNSNLKTKARQYLFYMTSAGRRINISTGQKITSDFVHEIEENIYNLNNPCYYLITMYKDLEVRIKILQKDLNENELLTEDDKFNIGTCIMVLKGAAGDVGVFILKNWSLIQDNRQLLKLLKGIELKNHSHENRVNNKLSPRQESRELKQKTLQDIWPEENIKEYHLLMEFLKKDYGISGPFINQQHQWNVLRKDPYQYLAGLLITLIAKQWVRPYSAPVYHALLQNTFDIKFNIGPLKNLEANPPDKKYSEPFISLPSKKGPQ